MTRCGFVAIVGRPNVGKSTLLNALLGEKISITSPKPQTTRWQLLGIQTLYENNQPVTQILYLDTPGLHRSKKRAINRYMNRAAQAGMQDAQVILWLIDATTWQEEDDLVLQQIKRIEHPVILVINKIDLLTNKSDLLPLLEKLKQLYAFKHLIPISASKKDNVLAVQQAIVEFLPESPLLYPEDQLTDKSVRFLAAEIIREKIMRATEAELPYTTTVAIEAFKETPKITEIDATIWVERTGQKVIILGKKGLRLKRIATQARKAIEKLIQNKVYLRLWIKVKDNWTDDEAALRSFGYE